MKKILLCLISVTIVLVNNFGLADSLNDEPVMFAGISLAETEKSNKNKVKVEQKKKKIEKYEIQGYVKRKYVRFIVDLVDGKEVTGLMFNEQGDQSYVYGEYVDGILHIYDMKGEHFIVLTQ